MVSSGDSSTESVNLRFDACGGRGEILAGDRESQPATFSFKQVDAEPFLQLRETTRHRRMTDAQCLRCTTEAALALDDEDQLGLGPRDPASLQPMALGANHSGAKAFVYNLGESLNRELAEIDIDVTVLLPGPTDTQGLNDRTDIAMGNLPMTAMSVETLVLEGLTALRKNKPSHVAGTMNRWSARLMPRRLLAWMFTRSCGATRPSISCQPRRSRMPRMPT